MSTIVVLGGGIGGISAAFELKDEFGDSHDIVLVSDQPNFEFTPSNPWVAVLWRKPEAIRLDLEQLMAKHGIRFVCNPVKKVQPEARNLLLSDDTELGYDYLVIASGPRLAFDEIPGLGPHGGFTGSVCKTDHASLMASQFDAFCSDPGPVIVGAAQGASCYGPAYEYTFIIETELRKRKIRDRVPMTFVTPEPYIGHLGLDGVGDTKGMLESEMRERHIKWHTNTRIDQVEGGYDHCWVLNQAKPGEMTLYARVSRRIRKIMQAASPLVEPLSIDEAFLDVTGSIRLFGPAVGIAERIRADVERELSLTCSVGVAPNKFLAKIASDMEKPDGLVVFPLEDVPSRLWPMPVERLER